MSTAALIANHAAAGKRVLVLAENHRAATDLLDDVRRWFESAGIPYQAHNASRTIHAGENARGLARIILTRHAGRGWSVDVLMVPAGTPADVVADLEPVVATSTDPEPLRWY